MQCARNPDYPAYMPSTKIFRSIGVIVLGIVIGAVLSVATDAILESTGVFPSFAEQQANGSPTWLLLWATLYRTIYTFIGCYIAARLAPGNPMRHAMILGVLGFIANIAGGIAMWHLGQHWYPIALAILSLGAGWVGGMLSKKKLR